MPSRQQFYVAPAVGLLISWEKRYTVISAKRLRLISRWDAQQTLKFKKEKEKKKKKRKKRHHANVLRKLLEVAMMKWYGLAGWENVKVRKMYFVSRPVANLHLGLYSSNVKQGEAQSACVDQQTNGVN